MPTIWTYLRATAVVVGSSAALLTGGIAHADPVPAPPVPNIPQQLISSAANAPQILQNLATALGATPPAAPATPGISFPGVPSATAPASSPAAIPSIPGLTQPAPASAPAATPTIPGLTSILGLTSPAPAAPAAPAAPSIPGLSGIPGLSAPAAPAAPAVPQIPQAKVNMPALPSSLPVNMPGQLTFPQDLTALAAGQAPAPAAPAPASPAGPVAPLLAALP
ncbi:hypothetical protein [Mycobacterium malmoense]|uniref:hypothetical protein n=1 Tax=Mycobacterium malmoense TaxID=1780 RepID=UPI0008F95CBB|nr:hypothetical protein [Mycobacterium malmoense]OIN81075.1 hypothetical protein BMG05_09360 [Mycobacterium malmoense]